MDLQTLVLDIPVHTKFFPSKALLCPVGNARGAGKSSPPLPTQPCAFPHCSLLLCSLSLSLALCFKIGSKNNRTCLFNLYTLEVHVLVITFFPDTEAFIGLSWGKSSPKYGEETRTYALLAVLMVLHVLSQ
jgi:hypothetical protein